jgi:hypothetical protein
MGYALEAERDCDDLAQLLERIERLCANARSRSQCLALVGAAELTPARLGRLLRQLEEPAWLQKSSGTRCSR